MEMSTIQSLRQFINERLHTAAEEILGCFEATVAKYEDEIDRQRRLLAVTLKPIVKLQRIEPPQQHVCIKEEFPADLLEKNPSSDQEEPEPPQIKEEQEEHGIVLEVEQLLLKQEDQDNLFLNSTFKESDHTEPEPSDHQLLSHNSAQRQEVKGGKNGNSQSVRTAEPASEEGHHVITTAKESKSQSNLACNNTMPKIMPNICKSKKVFQCDTCGKVFKANSLLKRHLRVHTGEKPFLCITCGKSFPFSSSLRDHMIRHTGEKPFSCETCGKSFPFRCKLQAHMRVHTGEKPFSCQTCGKSFPCRSNLHSHMKVHTREKPFSCQTCGKSFPFRSNLRVHMQIHKGKGLHLCTTCGKRFSCKSVLKTHLSVHTGEIPFSCKTCGKSFTSRGILQDHMQTDTGEKPFSCISCG
ncbi:gastrula zinc finger protein XlCGF26.1-like [Paralichthys olivaceus]|uniref:gastrula zinc finger protein XlCGF26.1-like n=1 Tax=Paralichthys olivaceus TaxID=8255 RepID=UPI0037503E5E